jgi:hypothetical protein
LLSEVYRKSGKLTLGDAVGKREREILEFSKRTVPDSFRIAWPWLHGRG